MAKPSAHSSLTESAATFAGSFGGLPWSPWVVCLSLVPSEGGDGDV